MHLINFCVLNVTVCVRIYDCLFDCYCNLKVVISMNTVLTRTLQLSFVMLYTHKLGVTYYYVTLTYIHKHHHD